MADKKSFSYPGIIGGGIPPDRDLNTVTPSEWRLASPFERSCFTFFWGNCGIVSFVCLNCGYPTLRGQATCEACRPTESETQPCSKP